MLLTILIDERGRSYACRHLCLRRPPRRRSPNPSRFRDFRYSSFSSSRARLYSSIGRENHPYSPRIIRTRALQIVPRSLDRRDISSAPKSHLFENRTRVSTRLAKARRYLRHLPCTTWLLNTDTAPPLRRHSHSSHLHLERFASSSTKTISKTVQILSHRTDRCANPTREPSRRFGIQSLS